MNSSVSEKLMWGLGSVAMFVFLFLGVFRALGRLPLLRVSARDWPWIRRNKMRPYYLLFVFFLLIPVVAAIYKIIGVIERLRS
ncbi:MAG: hypothetical protein K0R17_2922 [Rariglobus sp.]|jgi:hypothetical protein|nr:hypothetical protein [Rariglobus sp.]